MRVSAGIINELYEDDEIEAQRAGAAKQPGQVGDEKVCTHALQHIQLNHQRAAVM